jgi:hypothetical protein
MMTRLHQLGRTLLLSALVLGLNALGLLALTHARHPSHMRANVTHGHHAPSRRASRGGNGGGSSLQASVDHTDSHVAPRSKPMHDVSHSLAFVAITARMFAPEFVSAPLAEVSEVARGSAPRAPGDARGPPLS